MTSLSPKPRCVILGGGGHARVVIDCLRESGIADPFAVVDADSTRWGGAVDDVAIRGGDDQLATLRVEGVTLFAVGIGQGPRAKLFAFGSAAGFAPVNAIHPRATISARATIGAGVQIFAAAVVNAGATIGENNIVNTGAIIEHDCRLGVHVHVASGACLAGGVVVEDGAFIGAGSTIRQGVRIGAGAIVGAGAVVTRDVPPSLTVAGVPARELS